MNTSELRNLDRKHIWHPFTPMGLWLEGEPLVITGGEGFYLTDSDGRRYLDGVSSLWCNVHGHRVAEIDGAIRGQLEKVAHSTLLGLANEPSILLAERLMKFVPKNLTKVFFSDAGATATEIAFKLAAQYWYNVGWPEKHEFIAFTEAYHGDTLGAVSVGRTELFHKAYLPLLFKVHYAPTPFAYRWGEGSGFGVQGSGEEEGKTGSGTVSSDLSEGKTGSGTVSSSGVQGSEGKKTGTGTVSFSDLSGDHLKRVCLARLEGILREHSSRVAAICIEPVVQGAAGMIVHPPGFLARVRRLATQYDVLLICDEVATGFGRTGKMFAVEHEDVRPDLMCVAKGLSGGYLPLAATFASQEIFEAFLGRPGEGKTFFHGHTYTGNPLACAAAIANLELMERNGTVQNVARNAPELARLLEPLKSLSHVGDIRQKGYMVGIELVKNKGTRERFDAGLRVAHGVCERVRERGVILRAIGDTIILMPAPAMGVEELRVIVAAVGRELEGL